MGRAPRLVDVRQIGPKSEKDISGKCSACGMFLLTRLNDSDEANPDRLREKLEDLFALHLIQEHGGERTSEIQTQKRNALAF